MSHFTRNESIFLEMHLKLLLSETRKTIILHFDNSSRNITSLFGFLRYTIAIL